MRYERLAEEMRNLERRFRAKTAELHKQYGRELERQRRALLSGEKVTVTTKKMENISLNISCSA